MKVRLFFGSHAYAMIENGPLRVDFRLEPGRSAAQSLRETAAEYRAQAERKLKLATLADDAANILEAQK